jgi:hypothetical protein
MRWSGLGVPGHRAAFADDVEADRQFGAEQLSRRGIVHEGHGHRVAPHRTSGGYRSRALAGEADRLVAAEDKRRGGTLQADMDAIKGDRPGPERVGKPEPASDMPIDRGERSVESSGRAPRSWATERQIADRAGPRVTDRIGALHRARPARHPFLRGLCRGGGSAGCGHKRHYKTEDRAHAFSLLRDC